MFHRILTRFNIASPGREIAIRNSPGWLERRFALFERYCLPSIAAQSNRDFGWIIYFDKDTPAKFVDRIDRNRTIFPFTPRYVALFEPEAVAADVRATIPSGETLICTTRLDNDDAVSSDFVDRIQQAGRTASARTVLNFTNGIAMRDGRLFHASDISNPFTTLVEHDAASVETIWGARHHELHSKWDVQQVSGSPVWLQVVHGENVTNRIKGAMVSQPAVIERFRMADDVVIRSPTRAEVAIDHLLLTPFRTLREWLFKTIKPLIVRIRGE